ncbi:MAG: TIM barrel protein [Bacteroidia bacterium]|nr:TIM barrel protein [Bacteroidia bacterium]
MKRRTAIRNFAKGIGIGSLLPSVAIGVQGLEQLNVGADTNINHSVCRWCYEDIPLEAFCEAAQDMGISSIELTTVDEWPVLQKYKLSCAMATHKEFSLTKGFNDTSNHGLLHKQYLKLVDQAAEAGLKNVIVFSGNRNGLSDEDGIENCAIGLEKVLKHAQKKGITIMMELLNSKVDHKDYQCDHTDWGVALAKKMGHENFKLLYDIYHMQIMEGDIIATIRANKDYIGHYHTGGVPGRHEINSSQELNYPAIMKAIVESGFDGFVAQEFIPTKKEKLASLREGIAICNV